MMNIPCLFSVCFVVGCTARGKVSTIFPISHWDSDRRTCGGQTHSCSQLLSFLSFSWRALIQRVFLIHLHALLGMPLIRQEDLRMGRAINAGSSTITQLSCSGTLKIRHCLLLCRFLQRRSGSITLSLSSFSLDLTQIFSGWLAVRERAWN